MVSIEEQVESWNLSGPPIRPSYQDLQLVKKHFELKQNPSVLILGITPEIIDFCNNFGCEKVAVIDILHSAVEALKSMCLTDCTNVEFLVGDWRTCLTGFEESFDFVIGHGSFLFLEFPDEWSSTLLIMNSYLRKNGVLLLRNFHGGCDDNFMKNIEVIFKSITSGRLELAEPTIIKLFSETRCAALRVSCDTNGNLNIAKLFQVQSKLLEKFDKLVLEGEVYEKFKREITSSTAKGYGTLSPIAGPNILQLNSLLDELKLKYNYEYSGSNLFPDWFTFYSIYKI